MGLREYSRNIFFQNLWKKAERMISGTHRIIEYLEIKIIPEKGKRE